MLVKRRSHLLIWIEGEMLKIEEEKKDEPLPTQIRHQLRRSQRLQSKPRQQSTGLLGRPSRVFKSRKRKGEIVRLERIQGRGRSL
jgi:hypothetical protein